MSSSKGFAKFTNEDLMFSLDGSFISKFQILFRHSNRLINKEIRYTKFLTRLSFAE